VNPYDATLWEMVQASRDRRLVHSQRTAPRRLFNPTWQLLSTDTRAACLYPVDFPVVTTYHERVEWLAYDQILVSAALTPVVSAVSTGYVLEHVYVVNDPVLLTEGGLPKPLERGGISDHLPLVATFRSREPGGDNHE
jgi:hypothetical protein